jgi:hypothetical protein
VKRILVAAGRLARRAIAYELRMWADLVRWVLRRPVCAKDETPFGYARAITPIVGGLIAASAIEIPALHLLVPWERARFVVDLLGVYGLLWMLGLLAGLRMHPHVVAPDGLRVRGTGGLDVTVPWEFVASVRAVDRTVPGRRAIRVEGSTLSIAVMNQTNVEVAFHGPTTIELPRGETEPLRAVGIAADEPAALVAAMRERIGPTTTSRSRLGPVTEDR